MIRKVFKCIKGCGATFQCSYHMKRHEKRQTGCQPVDSDANTSDVTGPSNVNTVDVSLNWLWTFKRNSIELILLNPTKFEQIRTNSKIFE